MSLYHEILAHPFFYDHIRPRLVGGLSYEPFYALLDSNARRHVLDVGCGTGDALNYLSDFESYLGVDTNVDAIETARRRWRSRPNARFECRTLVADDVAESAPTAIILTGVLHHLTNTQAEEVFRLSMSSPRLARVITADIVFKPGELFNNVMAMMDRGRHCRHPDAYASLARAAGLRVAQGAVFEANPRLRYFAMTLERQTRRANQHVPTDPVALEAPAPR